MQPKDATFFQPKASFEIIETVLPHWDQPGTFAFVTFRLKDSLPAEAIRRWKMQRDAILRESGIDPRRWEASLRKKKTEQNSNATAAITKHLSPRATSLLKWKLFLVWDNELDAFHGSGCLRDSQASQIIADGLLKFDRDRYVMAAFSVLPNHVHVLAAFESEGQMLTQGAAWRQYFAREINSVLRRTGHLWQPDQFDHLVRSPESFDRIRRYIIENPFKAKLHAGEYRLYVSKDW
jgi:putative transposase